jgi:hypothetical protein
MQNVPATNDPYARIMLKRTTALAAAATTIGLIAGPAQAQAQTPTDAIQPIVQNLPHTPALPPALSPDLHFGDLPGIPSISPSPNIPQLDETIPVVPWDALPQ